MPTPIAVLISDIHYSLANLTLSDAALRQAIGKANELNVPLIIAGDLHDSKANLRGECVKAMIETFKLAKIKPIVLVGNHDLINEKDVSKHSLEFLQGQYATVQKHCGGWNHCHLVSYHSDPNELRKFLKTVEKGSTLIMHQGLQSSNMGDYVQDKSAITKEDVSGFRVISGHYHARQTIDLPDGGKWDYIGSPFTMTYGEANDPPKGFQILMSDGSLEFIPTKLRKHVIVECSASTESVFLTCPPVKVNDLLWVKITDTKENLQGWSKNYTRLNLLLPDEQDFRLDLIPIEIETTLPAKKLSQTEQFDDIIDSMTNTSPERKTRLKELWRNIGT